MSRITIPVRPRTLRLRLAFAGLGALAAAGIMSMPQAHADSSDLVTWAYNNGFTGTPNAIVLRGALVCTDLANGHDGNFAARDLWLNTGIVDINDAGRFVIASVENLCPIYDHRGEAAPPTASATGPVKA